MPYVSHSSTMTKTCRNLLVVPPFECAWLVDENLRFPEAGRGCIAFEACADNDVTVVLKEKAGSKHYRTDMDPNYAIVLGSHRNRRLRIEVDGTTLFDAAGVMVSPSRFERFWISICEGHITVGKGDPGKGVLVEWIHSDRTRKVQFVGLSSWDKHVGYRNIRVLPYSKSLTLSARLAQFSLASVGLAQFLESSEFADLYFCVGSEGRLVPAHRLVLACCCTNFSSGPLFKGDVVMLPSVDYSVLHACLQYMYTGKTQLSQSNLGALQLLCEEFGLLSLASQCQTLQAKADDRCASGCPLHFEYKAAAEGPLDLRSVFSADSPIDPSKLGTLLSNGEYADVEIMVDRSDVVARAHKLVLSAWSTPLMKMFTNGMWESNMTKISIRDVQPDVFVAMLKFMYNTRLDLDYTDDMDSFLLSLLILADRFGLPLLQHACSLKLIEVLAKDFAVVTIWKQLLQQPVLSARLVEEILEMQIGRSAMPCNKKMGDMAAYHISLCLQESVCSILHVAASLPCCELLQDACVEFFAKHFEECIYHTLEWQELDLLSLKKIIQSSDLCVATEERVLNATIMWASVGKHIHDWREANDYLNEHSVGELFGERLTPLNELLQYVGFALLPPTLLQEIESCSLSACVQKLKVMASEALEYLAPDKEFTCCEKGSHTMSNRDRLIQLSEISVQFRQRSSNLKELLYICDGDSNGVIYYAGTSYGAHAWMNPALTKKMSVTASSPPSRFTDAKSFVSRQYQGTSFAGPCFEEGRPCSWWKIDLGENNQLMCNHYTVRQDGSVNYIRSWSLQGSTDDRKWLDLRVHHEEKTLSRVGQFASWPIHSANAHVPLRFFRIILTGPTSSSSHPWNLCICYIELYGYFSSCEQ